MALSELQIWAAAQILHHVVTSPDVKLAWGVRDRTRLSALEKAGKPLTGPRVAWMNETKVAIIRVLGEQAGAYDDAHPHDKISVADFLNVLGVVVRRLKSPG